MISYHESLYTKEQTTRILSKCEVKEPLPGKGKTLWVSRAGADALSIEKTDKKGTDGRLLYSLKLWR